FFFYSYRDHRDLHSFPTRRSSDLRMTARSLNARPVLVLGGLGFIGINLTRSLLALGAIVTVLTPSRVRRIDAASAVVALGGTVVDRKSTRLNSSHVAISYAVFCLK